MPYETPKTPLVGAAVRHGGNVYRVHYAPETPMQNGLLYLGRAESGGEKGPEFAAWHAATLALLQDGVGTSDGTTDPGTPSADSPALMARPWYVAFRVVGEETDLWVARFFLVDGVETDAESDAVFIFPADGAALADTATFPGMVVASLAGGDVMPFLMSKEIPEDDFVLVEVREADGINGESSDHGGTDGLNGNW